MNSPRYQELLGRLLEGELSGPEAEELAAELEASHDLRRDLRRHLVLWETWSQHEAPERSSEAFVNAWRTRLRAESEDANAFAAAVRTRLGTARQRPGAINAFVRFIGEAMRRPTGVTWAASLLFLGLAAVLCFAVPRSAHAVTTLSGEAVCTACVLHESHEHAPALRVIAGATTNVYYIVRNPAVTALQDYFCSGPVAAIAKGRARTEKGRRLFQATTVTIPERNQPRENSTNSARIIFPI